MLVLSRKEEEAILFPSLEIAVQILRVQGKKVCLGIVAPPEVKVVRNEIAVGNSMANCETQSSRCRPKEFNSNPPQQESPQSELQGLIHSLQMKLSVLEAQLRLGRSIEAAATLRTAIDNLMSLTTIEPNSHLPNNHVPTKADEHVLVV